MVVSADILIHQQISEVFDYTVNHVTRWSRNVVKAETIEKVEGDVGTMFRCVVVERGTEIEFLGTITESNPPYKQRSNIRCEIFGFDTTFLFEKATSHGESHHATKVTVISEYQPKSFMRILAFFTRSSTKKAALQSLHHDLAALKKNLEEKPNPTSIHTL